jgi:hypothetical protein
MPAYLFPDPQVWRFACFINVYVSPPSPGNAIGTVDTVCRLLRIPVWYSFNDGPLEGFFSPEECPWNM